MVVESEECENQYAIEYPVLVTERLVLRPPHIDDVPDLAELANNRNVSDMLARLPHPYGEAEARTFVEEVEMRFRPGCNYAIALTTNGAFIGCAGLRPQRGTLKLGYWIGERYWGQGYATEVAQALVDLAFRATDIPYLDASCQVINDVSSRASRRVIHKCGFQHAGHDTMVVGDTAVASKVPIERYRLDRNTWVSLRSWGVGR